MSKRYNRIKRLVKEDRTPYTGTRNLTGGWRKKIISESDWTPVTGSIANSTSQTFEDPFGARVTVSGLGGVEAVPSTVTIGFEGETFDVPGPNYSQLGLQGYAPKINPKYAEAKKKYDEEYAEWEKARNENFVKMKDTLKSFGTSFEELRASKKWVKKLGDGTFVALMPTSSNADIMNWTDNVRVVKLKQAANADPMYIDYNTKQIDPLTGKKYPWMAHNVEIQNDVYLGVGERPKPPMEQEYLMPRRTDFKDVNPQLDASQEFAQNVDSDYMMNARVQSGEFTPKQQAAIDAWNKELRATMDRHGREWEAVLRKDGVYDPEKHKGLQARHDAEMESIWNKEPKFDDAVSYIGDAPIYDPYFQRIFSDAPTDPYSTRDVNFRTFDKRSRAAARRRANQGPRSAPIPILDYGINIARSIRANKPIRIPQSQIPQSEIDKLVQGLSNSYYLHTVPINRKEQPYSDEHIYELPNGEVRTHTADTKKKYGDNTMPVHSDDLGLFGRDNPLGAAGQAQVQFIKPKKGEPYMVYTDHAYRNLNSTDPGEASYNPLVGAADRVVHTVLGKNDPNEPNTGAMANHPSYIKGDVRKRIKVPYSKLTQDMKDVIDSRTKNFNDEDWTKVQESNVDESLSYARIKALMKDT